MQFDPNNHIVKLCAEGMNLEGEGKQNDALLLFEQAWTEAANDFEKFIAAHYVARNQDTITDKLKWDKRSLDHALSIDDSNSKSAYPSLYLNIGKCYEDLKDFTNARTNYQLALSLSKSLPDDGYGKMIKAGILNGIERVHGNKLS